MSLAPYTLVDLARDLNRCHDWASRHWRDLVAQGRLPRPIEERGSPVWDRAHVYALRDKSLPTPATRAIAAAIRAAYDAAAAAPEDRQYHDEIAESSARLDRRFGGSAS